MFSIFDERVYIFNDVVRTPQALAWSIPSGVNFVNIICIGAGGGGGGGRTAAVGTGKGGGGGGACGCISVVTYQRIFLPDILYIQCGVGGAGGAAGVSGTSGTSTIVSLESTTNANFYICNASAGNGGTGTQTTGSGAGGTLTTNNLLTQSVAVTAMSYDFANSIAGAAGGTSVGSANGGDGNPLSTFILSGGAGGGGTASSVAAGGSGGLGGGQTFSTDLYPSLAGGTNTTTGPGVNGFWSWRPMFGTGGSGGGSWNGLGGAGGDGAYGCGGGGGGGGTTGGAGGKGGNGLVIITVW